MDSADAQYGESYDGSADRLDRAALEKVYQGELAGEAFYVALAEVVGNDSAAELLRRNAREERAHARRIAKAISILDGKEWTPSAELETVPPVTAPKKMSWKLFNTIMQGEFDGDASYEKWARNEPNPDVAALLRLNGREETIHAERVRQVMEILGVTPD